MCTKKTNEKTNKEYCKEYRQNSYVKKRLIILNKVREIEKLIGECRLLIQRMERVDDVYDVPYSNERYFKKRLDKIYKRRAELMEMQRQGLIDKRLANRIESLEI